jgi:photosystem II stability/assembly factor-like uncharacterized protein
MRTRGRALLRSLSVVGLLLVGLATLRAAQIDAHLVAGLMWRNIGPFRGGRVSAVTGVIGQPGVFYAGLPLGGVWKTTSAGETWFPIFDAIKDVSCIGALEVAPSDPNVIYAGTGDLVTGGGINEGNGIYKSSDAGKTWQHLGLDDTKQIPAILVDPHDPNLVLVAAQGNLHTQTDQRGVFRSVDGGKTWRKTLFVDNQTGVQTIAWAPDHPNVILATTVRHYTPPVSAAGPAAAPAPAGAPGGGGRGAGGAPGPTGTALYKSIDEGLTWTELPVVLAAPAAGGPPPALSGRTSVAIANHTNAQRMFLVGSFGLYRSDDGGASWHQMDAADRRITGSGYICDVYVDPQNPDIVYTMNTSSYRSLDGGNTFTGFKGAPGGDDPHVLWIDPTDGKRMFMGGDQGATISLDGGDTWSSWYNQPTAQVYHLSTDTSYPYWVYATQQDSGSIATRSRGDLGAITPLDWFPTAGYEFGYILADPLNPKVVYAGGPGGGIVKITSPSGQWINVSPNVDASDVLRKVTNQPMAWSPSNPHELLVGFQYVMATSDGGMHWRKLSADLGYPKGQTPPPSPAGAAGRGAGPGGRAGGPAGGAIETMSLSTLAPGTIWVGTNNGLIKLTKDHGVTWDDVTIPNLPNPTRADISMIDASHHDPAAAYVAVDTHSTADYTPHFYRTHDFGKTWTAIVTGLPTDQPSGSFARVIRADTQKAGLLFAGTESSVYVSFNDGDIWQPLTLNLPNTSFRDLVIHDNDLVAGTYGRGFWILDDYSPLRQITPAITSEAAHLFKPGDAIRVRRNVNGDTPFPPEVPHAPNPPLGAIIYYWIGAQPTGVVTLEVLDAAGNVVRHLSSAPIPPFSDPPSPVPDFWLERPKPMPTEVGTNRINWNIRYDSPPAFSHNFAQVMGAMAGDTPASPEGPLALPGTYTLKLTVDGKSQTQSVTVKNDPRSPATLIDLRAQHDLQMKIYGGIREAWDGYSQVAAMRAAVADLSRMNPPPDVAAAATAYDAKLAAVGGAVGGGRRGGGGGQAGGAQAPPTFVGVNGALVRQLETLDFGDMAPTEPMHKAYVASCTELKTALLNWRTTNAQDLVTFNAVLAKYNLKSIPAAAPVLAVPVCTPAPAAGGKR